MAILSVLCKAVSNTRRELITALIVDLIAEDLKGEKSLCDHRFIKGREERIAQPSNTLIPSSKLEENKSFFSRDPMLKMKDKGVTQIYMKKNV